MKQVLRRPAPPLGAYVETLWWSRRHTVYLPSEYIVPAGTAQLVIALHDEPIWWAPPDAADRPQSWRGGVVHGPQSRYYSVGPKPVGAVVGAAFRPGAAGAILGFPAAELLDRHVTLDDLWSASGRQLREKIVSCPDAHSALAALERALLQRLKTPLLLHPAVAYAVHAPAAQPVAHIRARTGYSHRHFAALFRTAVGLAPKQYYRIRRIAEAVHRLADRREDLAQLATQLGFADQAHFSREFRALVGVPPTAYRPRAPTAPHHHVAGPKSSIRGSQKSLVWTGRGSPAREAHRREG